MQLSRGLSDNSVHHFPHPFSSARIALQSTRGPDAREDVQLPASSVNATIQLSDSHADSRSCSASTRLRTETAALDRSVLAQHSASHVTYAGGDLSMSLHTGDHGTLHTVPGVAAAAAASNAVTTSHGLTSITQLGALEESTPGIAAIRKPENNYCNPKQPINFPVLGSSCCGTGTLIHASLLICADHMAHLVLAISHFATYVESFTFHTHAYEGKTLSCVYMWACTNKVFMHSFACCTADHTVNSCFLRIHIT